MQVGNWEVGAVMAGTFGLDGGAMFGVVPRALWEQQLPPDEKNRIPMAMRLMLARGEGRTVLVDAGAGGGYNEKNEKIYNFKNHEDLRGAISAAGVSPDDVTDVVLTHLHFDHAAGIAEPDPDTNGWKLVLPGATHHVQRAQYEHAVAPNPRDRASYFSDRLSTAEAAGRLAIHDGPWTLADGFDVLVFDGHTPGQQLPRVSGAGQTVFYCGDLIPTRFHIPTPYIMSYDLDPVRAMDEKVPILERAVAEGWVLFFEHDAHVAACRVRHEDGRFSAGDPVDL
jgi:glyoxylase-like metal-dependent hydrolase (beta-lactamase superfamily II)